MKVQHFRVKVVALYLLQAPFRGAIVFLCLFAAVEKISTIRWIALSTFRTTGP